MPLLPPLVLCLVLAAWVELTRTSLRELTGGQIRSIEEPRQRQRMAAWFRHRRDHGLTLRAASFLITSICVIVLYMEVTSWRWLEDSLELQWLCWGGGVLFYHLLRECAAVIGYRHGYRLRVLLLSMPLVEVLRLVFLPHLIIVKNIYARLMAQQKAYPSTDTASMEDEILSLMEDGHHDEQHPPLPGEQRRMIKGVLGLGDTMVKEAMTPRTAIVAVEIDSSVASVRAVFAQSAFSRLPVYRKTLDRIVGAVYAKDFLDEARMLHATSLEPFIHKVIFIRERQMLDKQLPVFRKGRSHLAIVQDDFGGTAGLLSLEDLLERIVGEIHDEFDDTEDTFIVAKPDGSFLVSPRAPLYDLNEQLPLDAQRFDDEAHDTIGALIFSITGMIPAQGELIELSGWQAQIMDGDERIIRKILLSRTKTDAS